MKKSTLLGLLLAATFVLGFACLAQASPINLALSGTASQSSNYSNAYASRAIDGNTNGNYFANSVSHTGYDAQAWWKVDLEDEYELAQIVLWNRTDGWSDRLSNFKVAVLDESEESVWSSDYYTGGGTFSPSMTIDLPQNTIGQFVKVQLNGSNWLQLAEVQVYASAVPVPPTILLLGAGLVALAKFRRR